MSSFEKPKQYTLWIFEFFFRVYCPTADDTPFVLRMNIIFCQSTVSSPHVDTSSISTTESLSYMTWCHLVFICEYVRVRYLLHVRRMFTTSCGLLELLWVAVAIQMIWQSLHERVGVVTCILATIRVGNLDQHPHRQMKVCLSDFCWILLCHRHSTNTRPPWNPSGFIIYVRYLTSYRL